MERTISFFSCVVEYLLKISHIAIELTLVICVEEQLPSACLNKQTHRFQMCHNLKLFFLFILCCCNSCQHSSNYQYQHLYKHVREKESVDVCVSVYLSTCALKRRKQFPFAFTSKRNTLATIALKCDQICLRTCLATWCDFKQNENRRAYKQYDGIECHTFCICVHVFVALVRPHYNCSIARALNVYYFRLLSYHVNWEYVQTNEID